MIKKTFLLMLSLSGSFCYGQQSDTLRPAGTLNVRRIFFAGLPDSDTLTLDMVKRARKLTIRDTAYQITEFSAITASRTKDSLVWHEARCYSDSFSPGIDSIIAILRPGSTLIVDDVTVEARNGRKRQCAPRKFYIR